MSKWKLVKTEGDTGMADPPQTDVGWDTPTAPKTGGVTYDDILAVSKALDEADKHVKDRKMMINKDLQKSLSDVITMIEILGENRLEVWYGDDLYRLTLKIKKSSEREPKSSPTKGRL